MSVQSKHIADVTRRATQALVRELGIVDAVRFLNQLRAIKGDYTAERAVSFAGTSVEEIVGEIKARRSNAD